MTLAAAPPSALAPLRRAPVASAWTDGPSLARFRPKRADVLRVEAVAKLVEEGHDEPSATWIVLSSRALGYSKFVGAERPSDAALRRRLARLVARAVPGAIEYAATGIR